mmetsp:Transcript_6964/g.10988  ORF Transcript_6964/g.10988 Transcript_6964/m.10988 type:complete len:256 (-) Transcript_6964:423-1190(-)|eukprot:CAMPEP_0184675936 /NCGR_PEP_ID=MMETSP0308-20130426/88081_1 /TAXON_ID=38269 /ORGANISM="Gloeochaete witrockiana, Strain SAG 46.84" /LENGTH=255 /DNA_ID=CAMNT_0027123727 /DNA_START=169 /DNA_END=936 /DNA_ORIENTATION=-
MASSSRPHRLSPGTATSGLSTTARSAISALARPIRTSSTNSPFGVNASRPTQNRSSISSRTNTSRSRLPVSPRPPTSRDTNDSARRTAHVPVNFRPVSGEDRPLQGRGRSTYNLDFLRDLYSDDWGDIDATPQQLVDEWEAYWNQDDADDEDWTYDRMLALDDLIERNNGLRISDFAKLPQLIFRDSKTNARTEFGVDECTICLERFVDADCLRELPCKHCFHEDCLKPWFKAEHSCPNCRFDLLAGTTPRRASE